MNTYLWKKIYDEFWRFICAECGKKFSDRWRVKTNFGGLQGVDNEPAEIRLICEKCGKPKGKWFLNDVDKKKTN